VDVFDLTDRGVAVVGTLPRGIPRPEVPWTSLGDVGPLAVAALGIVLVSLADTIAVSTAFGARRHDHVDPDREIVAVGVANVASGFLQGFPTSASSTRTAVAEESGARTQLTGLVGAAAVALLLVAAPSLLQDLPDAALAAVVIVAALALVDVGTLRRLWRVNPAAVVCSLAATLGVVFVGVLEGVLIAVGLSILLFFHRAWIARDDVLGRVPGLRGWHSIEHHPEAATVPGLLLYRFEAPLFFANAGRFRERVRELVDRADPPYHHVVLQCEAVTDIDETAAEVLTDLAGELDRQGIRLVLVELRHHPRLALEAYEAMGTGRTWITYRSVREAIETITGASFDELGLDD
jgi:MFS superfamily sulfate permease-like transporter